MNLLRKLAQANSLRDFMYKTYGNVVLGLIITFFVSLILAITVPFSIRLLLGFGAMIFLTIHVSSMFQTLNHTPLNSLFNSFIIISILEGVCLSTIYNIYYTETIIQALLYTIITFCSVSIYGYTTNRDLSEYRNIMYAGAIATLICSVLGLVYLFISGDIYHFKMLHAVIALSCIPLSLLFIAYETQSIKNLYYSSYDKSKLALVGATVLLIDFIYLFRNILVVLDYFTSSRKK